MAVDIKRVEPKKVEPITEVIHTSEKYSDIFVYFRKAAYPTPPSTPRVNVGISDHGNSSGSHSMSANDVEDLGHALVAFAHELQEEGQ